MESRIFEYSKGDGFLTSLYKEGIYKKRFIATSTTLYLNVIIERAFDGSSGMFHTISEQNAYIALLLINGYIKVTDFVCMPRNPTNQMKSFKVQGSENGQTWIDLVIQSENASLCLSTDLIHIKVDSDLKFSQLRLIQTGTRCSDNFYYLNFLSIDFFGIYEYHPECINCLTERSSSHLLAFYISFAHFLIPRD